MKFLKSLQFLEKSLKTFQILEVIETVLADPSKEIEKADFADP